MTTWPAGTSVTPAGSLPTTSGEGRMMTGQRG
jgi:hypothetical protein